MNYIQKINPEIPLRVSLGAMYAYSGYDLFMNPSAWMWAVPWWFSTMIMQIMSLESYLRMQGVGELIIALFYFSWFLPRKIIAVAAFLSGLELIFIILFSPQFSITFRDLGIVGATIALFILSLSHDFSQRDLGGMTKSLP